MPIYLSLVILLCVMVFIALAFAIAVTLIRWALSERETEWPANWRSPIAEAHPGGDAVIENEREAAAGGHRVA